MEAVQREDPKAQSSLEDAIRHQIVTHCQRIRVHLLIVNSLMSYYNDAVAARKATPAVG